jgi:hypothetical protein
MAKILLGTLLALFLGGCVGGSNSIGNLVVADKNDKTAELKYTSTGITSNFKFDGIMTGTYKDMSASSGIISHSGTRTLDLTTKAAQSWTISVRSEKKGYRPYGNISIDIDKPYVATIKENGKRIGDIVLAVQNTVDKKRSIIKTIGLGGLMNTNIKFRDSKAKILGKNYTIKSVYKDNKGKVSSNPIAYEVYKDKVKQGTVVVGKNAFGGRTMSIWLKDKQSQIQQQSVATILTVVGYSSLAL